MSIQFQLDNRANARTHAAKGFTIVELLIVIVVIGILAAIVIVAYNGIQASAQNRKIQADLTQLNKAVQAARVNFGDQALLYVTGSSATASACVGTDSSIDIADKTAAASCWNSYNNALNAISNKSGVNVRNLTDPWGRPYFIDENEKEGASQCGNGKDALAAFARPRVQNSWVTMTGTLIQVPYVTPGC